MASNNIAIIVSAQDNASKTLATVRGELQRFENKSKEAASSSTGGWLKMGAVIGAVSGVVQNLASRAIQGLSNVLGDAIKRVDTLNNSDRTFANMGFSAALTKKTMDALDQSIRGLPTSLDSAVSGVELLAGSTGDLRASQQIYTAMNDAILGFGGSAVQVQGAVQQLSQALSNGKVDAQTWNSLIQNGMGPALSGLAKQMGITTGALKDGLSTGRISVKQFQDALIEMDQKGGGGMQSFHKIAKDATAGIGTGFANARTAVTRGVADIIQSIGSQNVSNAISGFGKGFESVFKAIAQWIPPTVKSLKDFGGVMWQYLGPSLTALWNTVTKQLIPALSRFWKNVVEPMIPVLGGLLVAAVWGVTNGLNLLLKAAMPVINFLSNHTWVVWGLVTAFGALKGAMVMSKTFAALNAAFGTLTNKTIPAAMLKVQALRALTGKQMVMGGIVVVAALAAIGQVVRAVNQARQMVDALNAKKKSATNLSKVKAQTHADLVNLEKHGTPAQKARAQYLIMQGYAMGGFTGRGPANEIAGVVHRGEVVIPKKDVDQRTGTPKMNKGVNVENLNVYNNTDVGLVVRELGWRLAI